MKLKTTHYRIDCPGENCPRSPFSLVLLADLHNTCLGEGNRLLRERIERLHPEAVLSAGDLVTAKGGRCAFDQAALLVRQLSASCPVYLTRGNHECRMKANPRGYGDAYERYLEQIRGEGVCLLDDATETVTINGMHLALTGYAVPLPFYARGARPQMTTRDLETALGDRSKGAYQILLAHHPDFFPVYSAWGADLTLSGHVHGGIVRLPWLGGAVGATWKPFPTYTRGLYENAGHRMILSGGLGSHTIKLRINNPPELVVIDFC